MNKLDKLTLYLRLFSEASKSFHRVLQDCLSVNLGSRALGGAFINPSLVFLLALALP